MSLHTDDKSGYSLWVCLKVICKAQFWAKVSELYIPLPLNVWSLNQQQQHYLGDFRNVASHSVPQIYDIQICVPA